ncbi:MAG: SMP-30/gluconolactonase/LRE family protein [Acidimicrobiales bacterium]
MHEPQVILEGLTFGESPRWHDGRLWVADWGAHQLIAIEADGTSEVVARVESFPFCIDPSPDGQLLVLSADDQAIFALGPDGTRTTHADLAGVSSSKWNEIAVDGRGNAYIDNIGFDFSGEPAAGIIGMVSPGGDYRQVADDVWFPNGMAITPDGSTLIVAESYGNRLTAFRIDPDGGLSNRRVWADLGDGAPDGICLDAEGAVWYADVAHRSCTRIAEGGEVLQRFELDRGCFACALGGPGRRTLYLVATEWNGPTDMGGGTTGQVLAVEVAVAAAARPR